MLQNELYDNQGKTQSHSVITSPRGLRSTVSISFNLSKHSAALPGGGQSCKWSSRNPGSRNAETEEPLLTEKDPNNRGFGISRTINAVGAVIRINNASTWFALHSQDWRNGSKGKINFIQPEISPQNPRKYSVQGQQIWHFLLVPSLNKAM